MTYGYEPNGAFSVLNEDQRKDQENKAWAEYHRNGGVEISRDGFDQHAAEALAIVTDQMAA